MAKDTKLARRRARMSIRTFRLWRPGRPVFSGVSKMPLRCGFRTMDQASAAAGGRTARGGGPMRPF